MDDGGGGTDLNLKHVARLLGVHYMTAYRYVRQGLLPAERRGTQWRVRAEALAAFQCQAAAVANGTRAPTSSTWADRLTSCLLAADEVTGWQVLEAALAAGRSPAYCYTDVIAAALASIGERCAQGGLDVVDQHIATAVAMRLIAQLGARFHRRGRSRGTFVFGAPSGERHSVPIAIVADLVRLGGYDVLELGADVPAAAFASCARRVPRLVAIGVGVSQLERLDAVRATVSAIRAVDHDLPVLVGGFASGELEQAGVDGVTAFARDGTEALDLVERFATRRAIRRVV